MKNNLSTILLVLILVIGLSLLLYPSVSDFWNSFRQTEAIASYAQQVSLIQADQYQEIWENAIAYNQSLTERENMYVLTEEQRAVYKDQLNASALEIMAYIEIPRIKVHLPIYHGTEDSVLQVGVGHLEWTSLPTGGENTHAVFSGHRGLPSARLFTDLDDLQVGDTFMLHVLDEVLTYEVDQIKIVLPYEIDDLMIVEGRDLCTLVTCTPYGINSHRMLVRGTRIENPEEAAVVRVTADAIQIEPLIVAPVLAAPMLVIFFLSVMLPHTPKKKDVDIPHQNL